MNVIKSYIFIALGIIYMAVLLFCCHSCNLEECLGVACTKGICIHGTCNCNVGYKGKKCDTVIVKTFIGHFNVTSSCFTNENYGGVIDYVTTTDYTEVTIENVSDIKAFSVTAELDGTQGLVIYPQTESYQGQTWIISGAGYMTAGNALIIFDMQYYDATLKLTQNCTEIYVRTD